MNTSLPPVLWQALANLKMFHTMELLLRGAGQQEVLDSFEKHVLHQNKQYQHMLMAIVSIKNMEEDLKAFSELLLKQELSQNPELLHIYRFLQKDKEHVFNKEPGDHFGGPVDFSHDCGC